MAAVHRQFVANNPRRILGVFAHPDDETTACAGTFALYAADGVKIFVVTATGGEQGTLGTNGMVISREELPRVREVEQRKVAKMLGVRKIIRLGYLDGNLKAASCAELTEKVLDVMRCVGPDVVITFGPQGISHHDDHMTIHRAATGAFKRYSEGYGTEMGLYYSAIPKGIGAQFDPPLTGVETEPTTIIDIAAQKALKIQALRTYCSQQDAQELATMFEVMPEATWEYFHQAYPLVTDGSVRTGFW